MINEKKIGKKKKKKPLSLASKSQLPCKAPSILASEDQKKVRPPVLGFNTSPEHRHKAAKMSHHQDLPFNDLRRESSETGAGLGDRFTLPGSLSCVGGILLGRYEMGRGTKLEIFGAQAVFPAVILLGWQFPRTLFLQAPQQQKGTSCC